MKITKIERLEVKKDTGCLTIGKYHNFKLGSGVFVKNSADGRGSQIDSIGGNSAGFTELQDIYYFARKLYRALKYPLSRITAEEEKRSGDLMFGGNSTGEITRDEVKWAKFLERQQKKFCQEFLKIFMVHLEFKGLKKLYDLSPKKIAITMKSPSNYQDQIEQNLLESRFNNYTTLADREEISNYFCMKQYLDWDEETIMENVKGFQKDRELGLVEDNSGNGGY